VASLQLIIDRASGADLWLAQQIHKVTHKPVTVSYLQDLFSSAETIDRLLVSA
jgi:hypothetical protein